MLAIQINLLSAAFNNMQLTSKQKITERWPTFEEILANLHTQGIFIHSEQLAEFLLAHGLPVHLRYVPRHLRSKAVEVNQNYQGDMVRVIEELEPPCWDFSWMENIQQPFTPNDCSYHQFEVAEKTEQPSWDYSWMKF
jgi:hypothetical protein